MTIGICTFNTFLAAWEGIFSVWGARGLVEKGESWDFESKRQTDTKKVGNPKRHFHTKRTEEEKNPEIHKHTDIHELIQLMKRTKNGINSDFCSLSNRPNRWFLSAPFGFLLFAFGVTATHTQTHTYRHSQDKTLRMDVVDPAYNESHRRLMMAWQIVLFAYRLLRIASTNIFLWLVKHNSTRTSFPIGNNHMSNLLPLFRYLFNNREVTCKRSISLWNLCPWNSFFFFVFRGKVHVFLWKISPLSHCLGWWLMTVWRSRVCPRLTLILSMLIRAFKSDKKFSSSMNLRRFRARSRVINCSRRLHRPSALTSTSRP